MPRLPISGQDAGNWGTILNAYLTQSHNADGTIKSSAITNAGAASDATVVHIAGTETITGNKTFQVPVAVATPTLSSHATTKSYVDNMAVSGAPDASSTVKGIVKLAGDLGGTATIPTVPGLASKEPIITAGTTTQYYRGDKSWQTLDKTAVGLGNVDNTSDVAKPISSATQTALNAKASTSSLSIVATSGSYNDLLNKPAIPTVADATTTSKGIVQLSGDLAGTATTPIVPGLASKANLTHTHTASNISDSTTVGRAVIVAADAVAARTAIGAGTSNLALGTTSTTAKAGDYVPTKGDVGLGNVDNTSDVAKPISSATQTALNAKAPLASPSFTGTVTVPTPTNATDAATKSYVDSLIASGSASTQAVSTIARRLLAAATPLGNDQSVYSGTPVPTVTFTANTSTSSISNAVRVALRHLNATDIDVLQDPNWQTIGCPQGKMSVSSGDMARAALLTNGSSQAARFSPRFRIFWTGQVIEFYYRAVSSTLSYRIWIDGVPLAATFTDQTVVAAQRGLIKLDFGAIVTRRLEIEILDPEFGGAFIEPTASITKPETERMLLAALGDSHTGGASGTSGGANRNDTWLRRSADLLSLEYSNLAIGGSGFLIGGLGASSTVFRNRLTTDIIPTNPDILVVEGSWNDSASTVGDLTSEAAYVYNTLRSGLPNTLMIAAGPWVVNHTQNATLDSFDAALKTQAQNSGFNGYISFRDPQKLLASANAWAASTAYIVGDTVSYNGFAQKCTVGHTSMTSFDQTKWRSTALVNGTGKVGSTAGNGNADVLVLSDGIHGTFLAHQVKARFVTSEVLRIARMVSSGTSWAG